MGPQHPSTHGVFRLVLEIDGEVVVSATPTIGYLHTGIEKTTEQKKWQQVIPLMERMDYLGAQSNSYRVRALGREAARPRDARSREVDPRPARGAAADQQPPGLARHARHGPGRRVGDALLLPRAGADPQHQRADRRLPDVPELHPRGRAARRPAARVPRGGRFAARAAAREDQRIRGPADEEHDLPQPDAGRRDLQPGAVLPVRARRTDGARGGIDLRRAEGVPVCGLRHLRVRRADAGARRRLRPLPRARRGDAPEHPHLPPGARPDHADRRVPGRRPARRAAAEGQGLHRDGGADPALPDLLAGLHGAGGRRVRADRGAARRARRATSSPTARTGPCACTCGRRRLLACQAMEPMVVGALLADVVAIIGSTDIVMGDVDR